MSSTARHHRLVLVDLENLTGCSPREATSHMYTAAVADLAALLALDSDDLVVIGVNPGLAFAAAEAAPGARLVTRSGCHGAETRLIAVLEDLDLIARRFDEVVIASGDGAFYDSVVALNHAGVTTTVVSLPRQLATTVRMAAQHVHWLPVHRQAGEAA